MSIIILGDSIHVEISFASSALIAIDDWWLQMKPYVVNIV